jgi:hypothetical protein
MDTWEYNAKISLSREDWRNKYFNQIKEVPKLEVVTDEDGDLHIYRVLNYSINEDAALARKRELDGYGLGGF